MERRTGVQGPASWGDCQVSGYYLGELALERGIVIGLVKRRGSHPGSGTWSKVMVMRKARHWGKGDAPAWAGAGR